MLFYHTMQVLKKQNRKMKMKQDEDDSGNEGEEL